MMGVYHITGLGLNPGAVTVPLSIVYILLKQASGGMPEANSFFMHSGERGQEKKGAPEALIIFTSKEVIEGKQWDIRDDWFKTKTQKSATETIKKYLANLLSDLKLPKFYSNKWLKDIYMVQVNHNDFEDCFIKAAVTLNALKDKEIWINMIGGTNQINIALLTASGFSTVATRFYYYFQTETSLLHPNMSKEEAMDIEKLLSDWYELPVFTMDMGGLFKRLNELFLFREKVNVREIEKLLDELGFSKKYLAKLRSFINTDEDVASCGYMLNRWNNLLKKIEEEREEASLSSWKEWAMRKGILYEIEQ
jgi:hypothetical protein